MSKRHQSSRRKSYGRRQHEVQERGTRRERWPADATLELGETQDRLGEGELGFFPAGPSRLSPFLAD